mmetsp:Transcript_27324/g.77130  ORF Transcript_27324/g.77130 Transcript_27324/m.77130 type:complete len:215 (-) Transcript_27324:1760-2404(-)
MCDHHGHHRSILRSAAIIYLGGGHSPDVSLGGENLHEGRGPLGIWDLGQPEIPLGVVDTQENVLAAAPPADEGAQGPDVWVTSGHELLQGCQLQHGRASDEDLAWCNGGLAEVAVVVYCGELIMTGHKHLQLRAGGSLEGDCKGLLSTARQSQNLLGPGRLHELPPQLQRKGHSHGDVLELHLEGPILANVRVHQLPGVLLHNTTHDVLHLLHH